MAVPGLGRKFWTITSWTCPWRRWAVGDGRQGVAPGRPATRRCPPGRPVVKGMASAPGGLQGGQPPRRGLVRAPRGDRPGRGRATRASSPGWRTRAAGRPGRRRSRAPALAWGRRPVSSTHERAHGRQVVDGRGVAVLVEPGRGRRVALLGALAQGEQGLVAAGGGAGAGDGQHLVGGQVRATQRGPGPWRRCSSRTGRDTASSGG